MADNTPQGIVDPKTDSSILDEADDKLDRFLDDPVGDTKEEAEPGPDEGSEESSDEADDAEAEADGQPRDDKGRFLSDDDKVRLDDGSVVTLRDLKRGNLREADYTQKTQKVAAQQQAATERIQRAEQLESQLAQERDWTIQVLQSHLPQAPDPSLADPNSPSFDAIRHMHEKAQYDRAMEQYQTLLTNVQSQQARQQQEQQQAWQQYLAQSAQELHRVIPEWKDPQKFDAFRNDILRHGVETYGFTPDELLQIVDPRFLYVANDAIKWRKLQASKAATGERINGKPPVTPGRRQEPKAQKTRARERDKQTLQSTGGRGKEGEGALDRLLDDLI